MNDTGRILPSVQRDSDSVSSILMAKNNFKTKCVPNSLLTSHGASTRMLTLLETVTGHFSSPFPNRHFRNHNSNFFPRFSYALSVAAVKLLTAASRRYAYSTACFSWIKFSPFLQYLVLYNTDSLQKIFMNQIFSPFWI
jgi:hypothetical protein